MRMRNIICAAALLAIAGIGAEGTAAQTAGAGATGTTLPDGPWRGELRIGQSRLNIVFNFSEDTEGKPVCTLDSPDQGAEGIPAVINILTGDSLNVSVPSLDASYAGRIIDNKITGKLRQSGMTFDLDLVQGKPIILRLQTPVPPFPYKTEEVVFSNGDAVLSGTLTYPEGYEATGREDVPVVLMVTGSGQQNRDEEVFGHKPFAVIADYLARNGIASLRYDDRGAGGSTGDTDSITTATNAEDADAGIRFLRESGKFGKTGVLGHSEGGTIAFMLGARKKADFIISLAGAAVRGDSILVEQNRAALIQSGIPPQDADSYCTALGIVLRHKVSRETPPEKAEHITDSLVNAAGVTVPPAARQNLAIIMKERNSWLEYFIGYDPAEDIANTTCPVLAVNGGLDSQVTAGTNLGAIEKLLPENSQNSIKEYPGLNHMFQHCQSGSVTEYGKLIETFSKEVLKDIVNWIKEL